ncbi:MAG: hypothetical protein JXB49_27965 [Bacteroidales bacterium]|nr:hypothetical protein [Bacteroidales bacterium]
MKRFFLVCGLLILMMGIYISTVGSTYTVHSHYSRFGIVCIWKTWEGHDGWDFSLLLDSAYSLGFSWNSTRGLRSYHSTVDNPNHYFQNESGLILSNRLDIIDSAIQRMQNSGFDSSFVIMCWPRYGGTYDNSYGGQDCPDSVRFYWTMRTMVEIYDGDKIPAFDPLYNYGTGMSYPERTTITGETLKIKYWEICNEPANNIKWWPFDSLAAENTVEDLARYIRVATRAVHDANPNAKVIAPTTEPLQIHWHSSLNSETIYTPEVFWQKMFYVNNEYAYTLDSVDILCFHNFHDPFNDINNAFDSMQVMYGIWERLGAVSLQNKPVWWTEFCYFLTDSEAPSPGVDFQYHIPQRAIDFVSFYDSFLSQKQVERVFLYTMHGDGIFNNGNWYSSWGRERILFNQLDLYNYQNGYFYLNILCSNVDSYSRTPSADTIKAIICRNTPYINITFPDSGDILISGRNCFILYSEMVDYENHFEGPPYNLSYWVEISYDDGENYQPLINETNHYYTSHENSQLFILTSFVVPYVYSENCKIKVFIKDPDDLVGVSTTDNTFTIKTSNWLTEIPEYPVSWVKDFTTDSLDECDCIIELSEDNYLLAINMNTDSAGLLKMQCESNDSVVINDIATFSKYSFYRINSMIEHNDLFLLAGTSFDLSGYRKKTLKLYDENLNFVCSEPFGKGEIYCLTKKQNDEDYILAGWNLKLPDSTDICWIGKCTVNEGSISGGPFSQQPDIIMDNTFGSTFNIDSITGRIYSIIEINNGYLAVGYMERYDGGGGAAFFKFDTCGNLLDSASYPGYETGKWTCFYDVIEDTVNGGYIMAGRCDEFKGGIIQKVCNTLDTVIWNYRFYDTTLNSLSLASIYSLEFTKNNDFLIASAVAYDSITSRKNGVIIYINPTNGNIEAVTAPLSSLYDSIWNGSIIRPLLKCSDDGFITGCNIFRDFPWNTRIALCKLEASGSFENNLPKPISLLGISNYSVLLANSLFQDHSTIRFILPRQSHVKIMVYNILGQRVRTLADDERQPGAYEIIWDGRDNHGTQVSSGSYFLRFEAGEFKTTKSLTVIR